MALPSSIVQLISLGCLAFMLFTHWRCAPGERAQTRRFLALQNHLVACEHCGCLQHLPSETDNRVLLCHQCQQPVSLGSGPWRERAAALVVAAAILFVLSNSFVFMGLEVGAFKHEANLLSGVWALMANGYYALAALVFFTIFVFPLAELCILAYLVLPCYFGYRLPYQKTLFRWLIKAAPWSMLEIFLLGVLVTSVKLGDMATIVLGVSIVAFFILVAVLGMAYWCINKRDLWAWLQPTNCFASEQGEPLFDCEVCHALVGYHLIKKGGHCPRCHHYMYPRKRHSLQNTLALLVAAAIFYIPANMLPIMTMSTLFEERTETIFSGVASLMAHGLWGIALVVFVASLVVPVAKLIILFYLIWTVKMKDTRAMRQRVWLYRVTEWVGRWSMVDVFVVTLLTGLVQFGFLGSIVPGPALLPFAAVVILTMLAAHTFDPRLIWDAKGPLEPQFKLPQATLGSTTQESSL